ncbi:steroid receptor RNA activator 1 [Anolis carolinensis]|uniref:Steroid receptor RNA activator 1 n=1 Tax=Anolis carolinensis TaxID=28377 RepID=G1KNB2_ANOCA|nr:PREDICTED: steroid receptor RNA activator 1 [Anolis carolinensis]|eukprot:XP_003220029.1 PREDICTED: steroid receptor RNA activator 1 [Anolis carolinensis]
MAELYVKPGNRERGWNDPPQFSYGLQQRQGPRGGAARRGGLARRPAEGTPEVDRVAAKTTTPPLGPPPPPPAAAGLPASSPCPVGLPPPPSGLPVSCPQVDATNLLVSEDCVVEDVLSPLNEALDNCRKTLRKQICDDIGKRLAILQQMWEQGKLSAPVRKGMRILIQEFKSQHWDAADEIHRSLMVDHVTEVNQWMVGVKRLIAETRNLPTDNLATIEHEQKDKTSLEPECQHD